ncbi:ACT domain-containing protein [Patescibacteria group bacterium]|nr:ACT domain-containing protein [Patescibacteria group bacterium]
MSGISNLQSLLKSMSPKLQEGVFVFCTLSHDDLKKISVTPQMTYKEKEGISVVLKEEEAKTEGLQYEYTWSLITLNVHSDLDAVGFLAAILPKLGEAGISVNVVSAYYHDHLFIPADKSSAAMNVLQEFSI